MAGLGRRPAVALALVAAGLAGCGGEVPRQSVYSVGLTTAAAPLSVPALDGVVMVDTFATDTVLGSRRIAWREQPQSRQIRSYPYHEWNESPPRLLQSHLASCLASGNAAPTVVVPTDRAEADYILGGEIRSFEQQVTGPDSAAVEIAVALRLSARRSRELVWSDVVATSSSAANASPEAAVDAFSDALSAFCDSVLAALPRIRQ